MTRRRAQRLCAALLLAGGRIVTAAESAPGEDANRLHLSGFGTLGVVHANAPSGWGFQRDTAQRQNDGGTRGDIDTRLGVQANYRLSSEFELVGQLVAANRVSTVRASNIVSLAFASYTPTDDLLFRVGRLPDENFLLAEYRHVGFAYPFVRPPVENYGALPYAADGADLMKSWRFNDTVWKLRGIVGRSEIVNDRYGTVISLGPLVSMVLSRDDGNGLLLKASITRARLQGDMSIEEPLISALQPFTTVPVSNVAADASKYIKTYSYDGATATYFSLAASVDRGPWLANVEMSYFNQPNLNPYIAGWALLGHRWGAFTGYAGLSGIHTRHRDRPPEWTAGLTPLIGPTAAAQAQQLATFSFLATAPSNASQRTFTIGMRWDFSDRVALKLQWDRVHVDAHGGRYWSTSSSDPINANVGSATIDFVF